jgi:hypothetical protein
MARHGEAIRIGSRGCSSNLLDKAQHRHRIEARDPNTRASNWLEIINRDFDAVDHTTIVIDTAGQAVEQSLAALQMAVSARMP